MTKFAKEFRSISRRLRRMELMRTSMDSLPEQVRSVDSGEVDIPELDGGPGDFLSTASERTGPRRFLDFYGPGGVLTALERYGFLEAVRGWGYTDLELTLRADDERHTLLLNAEHPALADSARLVELVVRRDRLVPSAIEGLDEEYTVLTVDWLMLQNPATTFTDEKPRLPGQDAPGLGLAERILELLYRVVVRLELDALVTTAEHFHNAVIYRRELSYFDVESAGECIALEDALLHREGLDLATASWAVHDGAVRRDGQPFVWRGEAQMRAFHPSLKAFITQEGRRRAALEAAAKLSFSLDRGAVRFLGV